MLAPPVICTHEDGSITGIEEYRRYTLANPIAKANTARFVNQMIAGEKAQIAAKPGTKRR